MQDYTTSVQTKEVGDAKQTGTTDTGAVTFQVENWTADRKIWPHDQMYGVIKSATGEVDLFTFAEVAISEQPIKDLADGLQGRYFVGMNCMDKTVCDFAAASPHSDVWFKRGQTPALTFSKELFFLQ